MFPDVLPSLESDLESPESPSWHECLLRWLYSLVTNSRDPDFAHSISRYSGPWEFDQTYWSYKPGTQGLDSRCDLQRQKIMG